MIQTKLTKMLGIKYPIIQAGMGPFGTNNLCIASANAGVLGLVSSTGLFAHMIAPELGEIFRKATGVTEEEMDDPREVLKTMYRYVLENTKKTQGIFGVNCMVSAELVGTIGNFIGASKEVRDESSDMEKRFKLLVTSAGDPLPIRQSEDLKEDLKAMRDSGLLWFHVVPSVKGAKRCEKAGVDGIIASGHEGGYHTAWDPVHSMTLIPAVAEECPNLPVVAAGGFCDGKTLVAALSLGAVGVQMGTRFLCTKESDFVEPWKAQVVKADSNASLVARGVVGPARYLKTSASLRLAEETALKEANLYIGKADDLFSVPPELLTAEIEGLSATYSGDEENKLTPGGECAGRIKDMPTVKELVEEIMSEAEKVIKNIPNFVV